MYIVPHSKTPVCELHGTECMRGSRQILVNTTLIPELYDEATAPLGIACQDPTQLQIATSPLNCSTIHNIKSVELDSVG